MIANCQKHAHNSDPRVLTIYPTKKLLAQEEKKMTERSLLVADFNVHIVRKAIVVHPEQNRKEESFVALLS